VTVAIDVTGDFLVGETYASRIRIVGFQTSDITVRLSVTATAERVDPATGGSTKARPVQPRKRSRQ
jgi:hypothetical protein